MLKSVINIAKSAGSEILKIYSSSDFKVTSKADHSPLTAADLASHKLIATELEQLTPSIPILSEESEGVSYSQRKSWASFWLVDPLDGTKDFIAKNDQFAVNIALIQDHRPILGVIHIPVSGKTYWAESNKGAFCDAKKINNSRQNLTDFIAAESVFHSNQTSKEFFSLNHITQTRKIGASIKFCAFAEGKIDVYPRFAPTSEWDTAAGQIIVEEAGGEVIDLNTNLPLTYNKPNIVNPYFLLGRKELLWQLPRS